MKKALVLFAATVAATAAMAQTNQVLSRNAVGYVKVDMLQNTNQTLYIVRNDFVGLNGTSTIGNTITNQLPLNSQILLWDDVSQAYRAAMSYTAFGWGSNGTNPLPLGMSFFIRLPATATPTNRSLYMMGEVPDSITAPTSTMTAVVGLNLDGYPYPVSQKWTNTQYSKSLPVNSQLLIWNSSNQSYNAAITKTAFGWGASGNAVQIDPGLGFFVRVPVASTNVVFNEVKPYTWP